MKTTPLLFLLLLSYATQCTTVATTTDGHNTKITATRHQHTQDCLKVGLILTCKQDHAHTPNCYEKTSFMQCQQTVAQASSTQQQNTQNVDYGPQILGTFFNTVVPGFLAMVVGAESGDNQVVAQSLGVMAQGVGTIIDLGTRAKKADATFSLDTTLQTSISRIKRKYLTR